jgi:hypothetical protein
MPGNTPGLTCYGCGGRFLAVKDSRPSRNAVRRRRKCVGCGLRFTTFEIMSPTQEDSHRLFAALDFYEAMLALPEAQRQLVLAMVRALTPPRRTELPPLIGGPTMAGQLSLDAALAGGEPEEAPYG